MKLLLTSNGFSNDTIAKKLFALVGKEPCDTKIAYVPTAMNLERGDKTWFVNDIARIHAQGLAAFDIVDFSAISKEEWLPRFEEADVLFFCGGDANHLMKQMNVSGLADELPRLLKTRVYAGISAGSIVTGPSTFVSSADIQLYYDSDGVHKGMLALQFVPFHFRPHYNSSDFPNASRERLEGIAKDAEVPIYAVDDGSALAIVDGDIEQVGQGTIDIFTRN